MSYEKTIILPDPPIKWVNTAKRKTEIKTDKRSGKSIVRLKETTHYLTVNLWYANIHFSTRSKIVNFAKDYLLMWMHDQKIPKLTNCYVSFEYYRMDEGFDIDNKIGFWSKIFFDLLKEPSKKELLKAQKYHNPIKSINVLKDDNVKHLKGFSAEYKKGEHKLVITIKGDVLPEQKELFK